MQYLVMIQGQTFTAMLQEITVKSILNKAKHRDSWFLDSYTINPYSGCSFNCLYCYIRGSKYGSNMEQKVSVKSNALELLEKQLALRARKNQYGFIVLSSATDPYLQFEKDLQLTRRILELILQFRFPVHIITKSELVTRDLDLLAAIDKSAILPPDLQQSPGRGTIISFSFSTVDDAIGKIFEPGAPAPSARLETMKLVSKNGFLTGVSMMPLLPYISDTGTHLEAMFSSFKEAEAHYALPSTITLFGTGQSDSRTLVFRAVEKYYPHLLDKYKRLFSENTGLPNYYWQAFGDKMKELAQKYDLRNRICTLG